MEKLILVAFISIKEKNSKRNYSIIVFKNLKTKNNIQK